MSSSNNNDKTVYESVTVEMTVKRVGRSGSKFRYEFSPVDIPPEVTAAFAEFLRRNPGVDPVTTGNAAELPGLDDLSNESRRDH